MHQTALIRTESAAGDAQALASLIERTDPKNYGATDTGFCAGYFRRSSERLATCNNSGGYDRFGRREATA